jgi:hypothetical protein
MKYLGLMVVMVIMASLCVSAMVSADNPSIAGVDSKWVKTDMGLVYLDKDLVGYKSLGENAKIAADVVGYGNPYQLDNDGKNIDSSCWVAFDGQVTSYPNWFAYRASETYNNQKDVPVGFPIGSNWYTIPVGR